tara:strand:- start:157 stop:351 length:195 start_codon:yes stop_codon:yes gene_type:complete
MNPTLINQKGFKSFSIKLLLSFLIFFSFSIVFSKNNSETFNQKNKAEIRKNQSFTYIRRFKDGR